MISRWHAVGIVSHQVRYDRTDSSFLVIKHDGSAAISAGAQLQRTLGVFDIERLPIQAFGMVYREIAVLEEDDMRAVLPGNIVTDRAVAGVVIDRVAI